VGKRLRRGTGHQKATRRTIPRTQKEGEVKLEWDRKVLRRFDPVTGRERDPYIEVAFMQDRVPVRPDDVVRVTIEVLHTRKRKHK